METHNIFTDYTSSILWHWHFFREPVAMCWLWQGEGLQSTAGCHHELATGDWLEQSLGWQRHHLLWLILQKPSDSAAFPQVYSGMVSLRRWSSWSGMFVRRPRLALTLKGYGFYLSYLSMQYIKGSYGVYTSFPWSSVTNWIMHDQYFALIYISVWNFNFVLKPDESSLSTYLITTDLLSLKYCQARVLCEVSERGVIREINRN